MRNPEIVALFTTRKLILNLKPLPATESIRAAIKGPMLIPVQLAMTNNADARVIFCTETELEINCLTETSALPKPMKNLPSIASLKDLYGRAET